MCPPPLAALIAIEEHASRMMAGGADEENPLLSQYAPVVLECGSIEEIDLILKYDPEIDGQILVDRETGRKYYAAIGQAGRAKYEGSGEDTQEGIDLAFSLADRSIICFTELRNVKIKEEGIGAGEDSQDGAKGNPNKELRGP